MCASKRFSDTSPAPDPSSSCDLRAAASTLRVTFVGHFVQSAALPAPSPLAPPVKSLKTSASASVVSFSFLFGGVPRAWILHMFICLYDGGTACPQIGTQVKRLQIRNSFAFLFSSFFSFKYSQTNLYISFEFVFDSRLWNCAVQPSPKLPNYRVHSVCVYVPRIFPHTHFSGAEQEEGERPSLAG